MNKISNAWIQVGITLGTDRYGKVGCPECGKADLAVKDIEVGDIVERYLDLS